MGWARGVANRAFTETVIVPDGHGNGHGEHNGHAVEEGEHAAITGSDSGDHHG